METFALEKLTLEGVPRAIAYLLNEIGEVKKLLQQKVESSTEKDQWFDLIELCQYHPDKPSKATVYGWVNASTIPVHKSTKKLRFLKSEIDTWLYQGRKKTNNESAIEATGYLQSKKKRR